MINRRAILGTCLLGVVFLASCSKVTPPKFLPLTEAHQKFVKICQEEYKLNVVVEALQHTAWIYVPLQEELLQVAATPEGVKKSETSEVRPAIKYLQVSYDNHRFLASHDIQPEKTYAQSQGYKMDYTAAYQRTSQAVLTTVSRAYFEAQDAPQFFVVVISDIKSGVEIENIFYLEDLKRYLSGGSIPQEEFVKRNIYEVKGRKDWVGDTQGRHLAYTEITMPGFLAKQIETRVNFKYQKSSFPPSNDARSEILTIVAETFKNYNFTDFNYVELRDLNTGRSETVSPAEIQAASAAPAPTSPTPTAAE